MQARQHQHKRKGGYVHATTADAQQQSLWDLLGKGLGDAVEGAAIVVALCKLGAVQVSCLLARRCQLGVFCKDGGFPLLWRLLAKDGAGNKANQLVRDEANLVAEGREWRQGAHTM